MLGNVRKTIFSTYFLKTKLKIYFHSIFNKFYNIYLNKLIIPIEAYVLVMVKKSFCPSGDTPALSAEIKRFF